MEVQFGPTSVDEPNLLFKLQCKIKVFNTIDSLPNRGYNLVASSSKYGLVFVGEPSGSLSVYHLHQLVDKESESPHMSVSLPEKPTHVSVSCDYELLAVTGGLILCIYKVTDFQNPKVAPSLSIKYDINTPTYVSAMQWNPCIPDSIALAFYDGTLFMCQAGTGQVKKVPTKARCICWSPKGKQLVTGNSDGSLHQFKPDLTPAKAIPAPNLFEGAPVEALAVYWISTFQFAVVYKNAADNSRPSVTIVNTPKGGQPSCLNYEDICYSIGSNRPWYYFLQGMAPWNIILSASSNSMELATIGSADGAGWKQWCQPDEARPELPLTDKKQENYPVGVCIDFCAIHQLPWGENETLPHMPLLHVVSQTGLLTIFNVINLNNQVPQLCSPPQQLNLPAEAMTSQIPGEPPKPAKPTPVPAPEPKPQPAAAPSIPTSQFTAQPPAQPASIFNTAASTPTASPFKVPSFTPSAVPIAAPAPELPEKTVAAQPQVTTAQPKPTIPSEPPKPQPPKQPQTPPENAALKKEQEKINKAKLDQDLKNMVVKEVNDFQNELYNFMLKTRETQAKIQRDIDSINSNFSFKSIDTEQLKKECSIDELRNAIVQLKLELVRACAVIAEARTHSNAREFHQWTQADPLTSKRVSSVKKLAYYVQTQLDQAQKALDYKWSEASRSQESNMPGKRMIRPILDDVYQPLVKQQEILSRQQAVLRTLRKTLNECDVGPMFKSSSLLRNTPFRNKDPLSHLTKNILNMSIDPQNPKLGKGILTDRKLEALKDVLSNHKTVKIKPVYVEIRQHFVTMKENYERTMKEKTAEAQMAAMKIKSETIQHQVPKYKHAGPHHHQVKLEAKHEPIKQEAAKHSISVPSFTLPANMKPAPELANVARTLFADEPKQEPPKSLPQQPVKPFQFTQQAASSNTKSVLKDLLQTKSQGNLSLESNDSNNIFMGQNICSPTGVSRSSAPVPASQPSAVFTSKPISEMSNMFSKLPDITFEPQTSKPTPTFETNAAPTPNIEFKAAPTFDFKTTPTFESKTVQTFGSKTSFEYKTSQTPTSEFKTTTTSTLESKTAPKIHSETGEPESSDPPKLDIKPSKPMTNLFGMKPIPDVLKTISTTPEKVTVKPMDKVPEKSKENVPQTDEAKVQKPDKKEVKPLCVQTANNNSGGVGATSANNSSPSNEPKPLDLKAETKPAESTTDNTDNKLSATFDTPPSTPKKEPTPPKSEPEKPAESKSLASSLFGEAVASQPKSETSSQSSSIFASTNQPAVFGAKSVFGSNLTSIGQNTTTQSSNAGPISTSEPSSSTASDGVSVSTSPELAKSETVPSSASMTSVFGTTSAFNSSVSSSSSVFGQGSGTFASTSLFPATTASAFGKSVFGTTTQASVFDTSPSPSSVFGTAASQAFGNTTPTTQTGSIFGSSTTPASVFGTASPTQSVFGTGQSSQASVFGTPVQTTQASVFGTPTQTTQSSVFGTPTQTTQASVFGTPTQTTQASVFGTPTQTTQASVFGTPTQTTQASVFGTPTQATQASVFGTPTQTTQTSFFGTPTQTTQASVFGTPVQATQASLFGTPTQAAQTSVFGAPAMNSGSLFGGGESNLFASATISTTSAATGTSGGNIFGGSSAGSVFGGTNVFGGNTAFGQSNSSAGSVFGGASAFGQEKPATSLWAGGSSAGGFGSGFGQPAAQTSSIFGSTGGSFSAPSAGAFGSPQQPAFGTGDSQSSSVFGSPQQQGASAFGGSPGFGTKPAFGQSSGFGSSSSGGGFGSFGGGFNKSPSGFGAPAAFGGGASFGGTAFGNTSPGKMFGGNAAASFGSPVQQSNATFENLAGQNTLTFGSLAQSPQQQPQQPSFNT